MLLLADEAVFADPSNVHCDLARFPYRVDARVRRRRTRTAMEPPAADRLARAAVAPVADRWHELAGGFGRRARLKVVGPPCRTAV
jgi:hypothetical protein